MHPHSQDSEEYQESVKGQSVLLLVASLSCSDISMHSALNQQIKEIFPTFPLISLYHNSTTSEFQYLARLKLSLFNYAKPQCFA